MRLEDFAKVAELRRELDYLVGLTIRDFTQKMRIGGDDIRPDLKEKIFPEVWRIVHNEIARVNADLAGLGVIVSGRLEH